MTTTTGTADESLAARFRLVHARIRATQTTLKPVPFQKISRYEVVWTAKNMDWFPDHVTDPVDRTARTALHLAAHFLFGGRIADALQYGGALPRTLTFDEITLMFDAAAAWTLRYCTLES